MLPTLVVVVSPLVEQKMTKSPGLSDRRHAAAPLATNQAMLRPRWFPRAAVDPEVSSLGALRCEGTGRQVTMTAAGPSERRPGARKGVMRDAACEEAPCTRWLP